MRKGKNGRTYTDKFKAKILAATEQLGVTATCRKYDMNPSTIDIWKKKQQNPEASTFVAPEVNWKKKYGEAQGVITRMEAERNTLGTQVQILTAEKTVLETQVKLTKGLSAIVREILPQ